MMQKLNLPLLSARFLLPLLLVFLLAGHASSATALPEQGGVSNGPAHPIAAEHAYQWLNRLSWGASPSLVKNNASKSFETYLAQQLNPPVALLPETVNSQIKAMTISQRPAMQLVQEADQRLKDVLALTDDSEKRAGKRSYEQELNRLLDETRTRHILRAIYSPNQIQEQMNWFWLNHFSAFQGRGHIRAMLSDYDDVAIRPNALGKFRQLLKAVVIHPVMVRYLDNEKNAAGRINENYARELMELHTLGVDGGYTQRDVQELARVLTGVGLSLQANNAEVKPTLEKYYVRNGLFEFNPARHDFGDKVLLGQPINSKGLAEVDEAIDRLARHPATAKFISRKLAQYWLNDDPSRELVERMSQTFQRSDGDIAETLKTLLTSAEFAQGGGRKFKDPMRYVISAVRLAYDEKPIINATPVINWLNRMGEPLYGRKTPDGYPLQNAAWTSSGQMATRFEIAKAIGSGRAGLFRSEAAQSPESTAPPQLNNLLYQQAIKKTLGSGTLKALDQAASPAEWNTFLLSSPEMMSR